MSYVASDILIIYIRNHTCDLLCSNIKKFGYTYKCMNMFNSSTATSWLGGVVASVLDS